MRKFLIFLIASLMLCIAGAALAAQLRTTAVCTYTSLPNDPDPNVAPLAYDGTCTWTDRAFVVNQMATSGNHWEKDVRIGWMVYYSHDGTGGALSCDITPWVYDYGGAEWAKFATTSSVAPYTWMDAVRYGEVTLYWQVVCAAGPTVDSDHPVVLRAGAR